MWEMLFYQSNISPKFSPNCWMSSAVMDPDGEEVHNFTAQEKSLFSNRKKNTFFFFLGTVPPLSLMMAPDHPLQIDQNSFL